MCAIVDLDRSVALCDVGMHGYLLAACVDTNGDDQFWLFDTVGGEEAAHGDRNQPHELLGTLPRCIRERIWDDQLRCGRATFTGQSCRHRVKNPGDTCRQHRESSSR